MFYPSVLCLAIFLVSTPGHAEAEQAPSKTQKGATDRTFTASMQSQWPLGFFSLQESEKDSLTLGLRGAEGSFLSSAYTLLTEEGDACAHAHAVWHAPTALTFGGAGFEIVGTAGQTLGSIRGELFTLHRAWFNLNNAEGQTVAFAYVNYPMTHVMVVDATQPTRRFALLSREAADVTSDADTWKMHVLRANTVPMEVLTTLAFYITDHQDWNLLRGFQALLPGASEVATTWRGKVVDELTQTGFDASKKAGNKILSQVE